MDTWKITALLAAGVILAIVALLLRVRSDGKYEIKTVDLALLIIPLLLVALGTGKLTGLDLFGVKADLSALWSAAAQTNIKAQVAPARTASVQDVVNVMEMATKGGPSELQRLLERRLQALEFRIGNGGYYGPAIRTYFEALSGSSQLRSVVIDNPDGTLFGMYIANDLISYLKVAGDQGYDQFQQLLNSDSVSTREALTKMPGFVSAQHAVNSTTSKRDALARMEQLNTDSLPVLDDKHHFVGTVERGKLTSSLILSVTDKLEGRNAGAQ